MIRVAVGIIGRKYLRVGITRADANRNPIPHGVIRGERQLRRSGRARISACALHKHDFALRMSERSPEEQEKRESKRPIAQGSDRREHVARQAD